VTDWHAVAKALHKRLRTERLKVKAEVAGSIRLWQEYKRVQFEAVWRELERKAEAWTK